MIADDLSRIAMSSSLGNAVARAVDFARAQGHLEVTLEHMLLSLCDDPDAGLVLAASNIDSGQLKVAASRFVGSLQPHVPPGRPTDPSVSPDLRRILEAAAAAARGGRRREINGAIVLAAIVGDGKSGAAQLLQAQGLTFEGAIRALQGGASAAPASGRQPTDTEELLASARERVQSRSIQSARRIEDATRAMRAREEPAAGPEIEREEPITAEVEDIAPPPPQPPSQPTPAPEAAQKEETPEAAVEPEPEAEPESAPEPKSEPKSESEPQLDALRPVPAEEPRPPPAKLSTRLKSLERSEKPERTSDSAILTSSPSLTPPPIPVPGVGGALSPPAGPGPVPPPAPTNRRPPPPPGRAMPPPPPPAGAQPPGPPMPPPVPSARPGGHAPHPGPPPPAPSRSMPPQGRAMPGQAPGGRMVPAPRAELGQLVENIPRTMRVAVQTVIEVRVARAEVQALAQGLQGGGAAYHHEVTVTKAMSVRLRAPDGGFFIETASPETQWIERAALLSGDDFASWRWHVTPREKGRKRLQLVISARTVGADGLAAETALPDQVITVRVRTNYARTLGHWMGWSVAALIGGLLAKFGERAYDTGQQIFNMLMAG